ncbi:DNA-directed DNA polymerase alpha subunit POL12 [Sugiyamaella lignohabitans]|uniref:DNA polymerase alpha subunit B n=1 Tax=Sugiyamaella lignohabitans TaxID=796027 RepID=A0A161HLN6_9ASCO|nr:DNA-directed DNA polymerase alpha subunit POL12 [Sugiyamaella lignohabitans]ANB14337.1 DNA-directed DNA polymerase alpha subunit POL12 [Sugiyamaella lignohabitans]
MDVKLLSSKLGPAIEDSLVLSEWNSMLKIFALSSEDLLYKWESYVVYLDNNDLEFNIDTLKSFQQHLQNELEEKSRKQQQQQQNGHTPSSASRPTPSRLNGTSDILTSMLTPGSGGSISRKRKAVLPMQTPSRIKQRSNAPLSSSPIPSDQLSSPMRGTGGMSMLQTPDRSLSQPIISRGIVETLNGNITKLPFPEGSSENRVKLAVNVNLKKFNYRTMYQKLGDASEILDLQIEDAVSWVKQAYDYDDKLFGNPAYISQDDIIAVGRIVPDSPGEDKINIKSMMLESSRRLSSGMRIQLNFDAIEGQGAVQSFFPGQIVAFSGSNANGRYFAVKKILDLPLLPGTATAKSELFDHVQRQDNGPIQVFAASGPFTGRNNLDFEPLVRFIDYVNEQTHKPDTVILSGPFLDINHPLVQSGSFTIPESYDKSPDTFTLDDIFKAYIKPILTSIDPSIQVIIIPSVKDVISNHTAFPQRPLDRKALELPKNFKCLSNPATFQLNEVVFTASTTDSIADIVSNLVVINGDDNTNKITMAMEHVIRQRRVYPIFPAAKGRDGQITTGLDVPYLGLASIYEGNPDIIITPSMLKHTAQIVNNVVAINPGQLAKGSTGTFASITVNPLSTSDDGDEDEAVTNRVWERARVDIINI